MNGGGLNELALFAGAGGGILAGKLLGWRTVAAVEWEPYAASVLVARQNDGLLPAFPIWDDVCTFDGRPWRGVVDVVSGGFPCQDISAAGKGAGIDGERSGLWGQMARIVGEVRPRFVFVENSPLLVGRGLVRVLADLAEMGFDARWGVVGASDVGAPHRRERCWIVAYTERSERRPELRACDGLARSGRADGLPQWQEGAGRAGACGEALVDTDSNAWHEGRARDAAQEPGGRNADRGGKTALDVGDANGARQLQPGGSEREEWGWAGDTSWWLAEPDVGRVADGVAARVDRLKAIGNGQVPQCAAAAWRMLGGV
ncbi:MAG: DNA cytosine methyltransferase [Thauera sp.]|nr:DNA cytosine methyltransferase [Thauera sp.]